MNDHTKKLCVEALRHAARCQGDDGCLPHADALESGDLRIVADHNALLCNDSDCRQNTLIACSLLKKNIARLAALEKVLAKAVDVTGILAGEPGMSCLQPLEDALAELDALNGDRP